MKCLDLVLYHVSVLTHCGMCWHSLLQQAPTHGLLHGHWEGKYLGNIPEPSGVSVQCPLLTSATNTSCCIASTISQVPGNAGHSLNDFNLCPHVILNAIAEVIQNVYYLVPSNLTIFDSP